MSDEPTAGWRFVKAVVEGDPIEIGGINPWKRRKRWDDTGDSIVVAHPLYPRQRHTLRVWQLETQDGPVVFAAGELSGLVWGFYLPDPTQLGGADLTGAVREPGILLFAADVERTAAFYRRLGCSEVRRFFDGPLLARVELESDGRMLAIALASSRAGEAGADAVGRAGVSLRADDVKNAYGLLLGGGVPGLRDPAERADASGRVLFAWVEDPDGRVVELTQRLRR